MKDEHSESAAELYADIDPVFATDTYQLTNRQLEKIKIEAFEAGAKHGRKAERARCESILTDELHDLELAEFGDRDKERTNIRAWLMNARERIRAVGEKE